MKHNEPIGLSATCVAMLITATSDTMYIRIGAIVIAVTSLFLINRYYLKLLSSNNS